MSGPYGDVPSVPLPSQMRQRYQEIMAADAGDPACVICKQSRCQERRYTCERLVCADYVPEVDPWRGLLNNSGGGGESS